MKENSSRTYTKEDKLVMEQRTQIHNRAKKSEIHAATEQEKRSHKRDDNRTTQREQDMPRRKQVMEGNKGKKRPLESPRNVRHQIKGNEEGEERDANQRRDR